MKKIVMGFLGLAMAMTSAACGSSSAGSCTIGTGAAMYCEDFGSGFSSSQAMSACPSSLGTYATTACTTTGRTGHCAVTSGGNTITQNYYSTDMMQTSGFMSACTAGGGTWTAN